MTKPIALTDHAKVATTERALELAWIERTAREPEWTEPEPSDPTLERRFRAVPERDGRILRVVCGEDDATIVIVTACPRQAGAETDMSVRLHYDAKTNAAYLRFSGEPVVESEEVAPGVVLDYDAEGRMVGMEVLRARDHLPADALIAAE